jgi:hypothetical protein
MVEEYIGPCSTRLQFLKVPLPEFKSVVRLPARITNPLPPTLYQDQVHCSTKSTRIPHLHQNIFGGSLLGVTKKEKDYLPEILDASP